MAYQKCVSHHPALVTIAILPVSWFKNSNANLQWNSHVVDDVRRYKLDVAPADRSENFRASQFGPETFGELKSSPLMAEGLTSAAYSEPIPIMGNCSLNFSRHHAAMRCPCCRQPLPDQVPACPQCQFNLASASQYFGEPVQLEFPLTDLAGVLGIWKKRAVHNALLEMSSTFPQLRFSAVLVESDTRVPLGAHAFWLFNTGGLSAAQDSGGLCRLVLLALDVANARAACMIGYGLEPFIPQESLDRIAAAALPELQRRNHAAAIISVLQSARTEFASVVAALPRDQAQIESGQNSDAAIERAAFAY